MTKRARRILVTSFVLLVAATVVVLVYTSKPPPAPPATPSAATPAPTLQSGSVDNEQPEPAPTTEAVNAPPAVPVQPIPGLRAVSTGNDFGPRDQAPQSLGSLDPRVHIMKLEFSRQGARIARAAFTDIWQNAEAKRQADRYVKSLQPEQPFDPAQVDESQRYLLTNLARASIVFINGQSIDLTAEDAWSETAPGEFQSRIVDEQDRPVLEISRKFTLGPTYDITLRQRLRNVSGQPLQVQWSQFGPTDLAADLAGYIDRRGFDSGYLPDPARQPDLVLTGEFQYDRSALIKRSNKAAETQIEADRLALRTLWPNDSSSSRGYHLSWFASMNRYFTVAVHPAVEDIARGVRSLNGIIDEIRFDVTPAAQGEVIYTTLRSPLITLADGAEKPIDIGLYVGPLDRTILSQPPFGDLAMKEMILYSMGGCCTFLTFQWLAKLLLNFLAFLQNYVVFDWGVAIVVLVGVVRTLLHPLTRKSQINMQRFGKQMQAMKPEMDKLKKKFGTDAKRMQAEQMKLMREHGMNPFQMLGCLPMFLQMPIWLALWAMLYLAFEIRHQPAFYGVFQMLGDWSFLGDLSSPDHFWVLPRGGFAVPLIGVQIDALNLLPLLLGVVFYIQQKYMSPPPSPNMTAEQMQQQKIMKIMMVVMMPVVLFKAPSGLTLYIFTSTCIGIMESKYIRAHIEQLDLGKPDGGGGGSLVPGDKPKKPKDTLGRMWAEKLEAARAKRQQSEPPRSFKKRK